MLIRSVTTIAPSTVSSCIVGHPEVSLSFSAINRASATPESLDVTLAYLTGRDAESEEAQEHVDSSSLALYA